VEQILLADQLPYGERKKRGRYYVKHEDDSFLKIQKQLKIRTSQRRQEMLGCKQVK